jgi:hypothetical protein
VRLLAHAALVAGAFVAGGAATWFATATIGGARLAPPDEFECIGAPDAHNAAVYLHGIDSFGPSWQELHNRDVLAELAARFDLRLALPRGVCERGRCWPEAERALPWIRSAARACLGGRPHGLIGFSNGGFLVGALARACNGEARWLLVASAGGTVPGDAARELAGCPPVRIAVGQGDRYHLEPARTLARDLAHRGGDVRLIEFDGGHELEAGPAGDALVDLVGRPGGGRGPWHATHAVFAVAAALILFMALALRRRREGRRSSRYVVAAVAGCEASLGISPGSAFATLAGALAFAALLALAAGAFAALRARDPRAGAVAALVAANGFAIGASLALAAVLWIL